jgi:hypothetical protein
VELYVLLVAGLFAWAGIVFFVIGYNDWNDLVGAFITLFGYGVLTESLSMTVVMPTSGEFIGRLLEFTFTYYGVIGIAALVGGAALGKSTGMRQRQKS